jgi:DNA-3-methyladenine glycosylase
VAWQQDHASSDLTSLDGPLDREFFRRDPRAVAVDLLGMSLESRVGGVPVRVRLTEVEAYLGQGEDPGSHSHRGRTPRTAVMFGPPGHVYVYFSYGMHWCANLVCNPDGRAGAVLLRAGEIVAGEQVARSRRPAARGAHELARGPARLCSALGITGGLNGADACAPGGPLQVFGTGGAPVGSAVPPSLTERVRSGPRVGLTLGADSPWRWWLDGERSVSVYRPAKPRVRRAPSVE